MIDESTVEIIVKKIKPTKKWPELYYNCPNGYFGYRCTNENAKYSSHPSAFEARNIINNCFKSKYLPYVDLDYKFSVYSREIREDFYKIIPGEDDLYFTVTIHMSGSYFWDYIPVDARNNFGIRPSSGYIINAVTGAKNGISLEFVGQNAFYPDKKNIPFQFIDPITKLPVEAVEVEIRIIDEKAQENINKLFDPFNITDPPIYWNDTRPRILKNVDRFNQKILINNDNSFALEIDAKAEGRIPINFLVKDIYHEGIQYIIEWPENPQNIKIIEENFTPKLIKKETDN